MNFAIRLHRNYFTRPIFQHAKFLIGANIYPFNQFSWKLHLQSCSLFQPAPIPSCSVQAYKISNYNNKPMVIYDSGGSHPLI